MSDQIYDGSSPVFDGASPVVEPSADAHASGAISITGVASGVVVAHAHAGGAITLSGAAQGTVLVYAHAQGAISITGQADPSDYVEGHASGAITLTGTARGSIPTRGRAYGSIRLTGNARPIVPVHKARAQGGIRIQGLGTATWPGDYPYGDGYPHGLSQPSGLMIWMGIGEANEMLDVTNDEGAGDGSGSGGVFVPRDTLRLERVNEDGSAALASYNLVIPQASYYDIIPHRYVAMLDPTKPNGQGGFLAYFAGFTMQPELLPQEGYPEREFSIRCTDYHDLFRFPPKQIGIQWPPGDGTPVVNTMVTQSVAAGANRVVTPGSVKHLYPGKRVYAQNSDGSNKERITIKSVDYQAGTFIADFATSKTSARTTVAEAMHHEGRGVRETRQPGSSAEGMPGAWVPASMSGIWPGSVLYCYQSQPGLKRAEYVIVEDTGPGYPGGVEGPGFYAAFAYRKKHDWIVESNWMLIGGVSDVELIRDGFKMHIDVPLAPGAPIPAPNAEGETPAAQAANWELIEVEGLIAHCFNYPGSTVQMFVDMEEVITSLPHGKFEDQSPEDVLNWVIAQNLDDTKKPRWYASFVQPTITTPVTLPPMLRYYDALSSLSVAQVALTNQEVEVSHGKAKWQSLSMQNDGQDAVNALTVKGSNSSYGRYVYMPAVTDYTDPNYTGRVREGRPVRNTALTTNAECEEEAYRLVMEALKDRRVYQITTYAQLDPRIMYEPQALSLSKIFEPHLPANLEILRIGLGFGSNDEGHARYDITATVGDAARRSLISATARTRRGIRIAQTVMLPAVTVDGRGRVRDVSPPPGRTYSTDADLLPGIFTHTLDVDDGPAAFRLPKARANPGIYTVKRQDTSSWSTATLLPFNDGSHIDTIDGMNQLALSGPNDSVVLYSDGTGDQWRVLARKVDGPGSTFSVNLGVDFGGSAPQTGVFQPVALDFAATLTAVRVYLWNSLGSPVGDSIELNIIRRPGSSPGSDEPLNSAPFDNDALDPLDEGWTVELDAHDILQLEIVQAPSSSGTQQVSVVLEMERR